MSELTRIFPEDMSIGSNYRSWPSTSHQPLRNADLSAAIIFKNEAGFVRIWTEPGDETIKVKSYPTKTIVRRTPPKVKFTVDMTPSEFQKNGIDLSKTMVEYEIMTDEEIAKVGHMLRIFADHMGNPGGSNGVRRSIML